MEGGGDGEKQVHLRDRWREEEEQESHLVRGLWDHGVVEWK